jgi:hypothetical protein
MKGDLKELHKRELQLCPLLEALLYSPMEWDLKESLHEQEL